MDSRFSATWHGAHARSDVNEPEGTCMYSEGAARYFEDLHGLSSHIRRLQGPSARQLHCLLLNKTS